VIKTGTTCSAAEQQRLRDAVTGALEPDVAALLQKVPLAFEHPPREGLGQALRRRIAGWVAKSMEGQHKWGRVSFWEKRQAARRMNASNPSSVSARATPPRASSGRVR